VPTATKRRRPVLPRFAADVAIAVGAAVAIGVLAGHSFPDYDATFALVWGHDLAHGHAPDYGVPYRPGGHPLTTALATVLSVLGRSGAAEAMRWIVLLGAGALVAGVFRLGQALFGTAAAVLAAILVLTRTPVWGFSLLGYMDVPAAALVVWAAVLEVRTPRRGASVLVLLALAGLVRPEAWLMAGAYWIWLAWGGRWRAAIRLAPLVVAAPLLWVGWDAATSQTFLGSVRTEAGVPVGPSAGGHGLHDAPRALARFLGGFLRPPEAIAAAAGVALAVARIRERPLALVPLGILAANVVGFVLIAWSGGALEQRYLFPAAAMLVLFAGYAALGWLQHPPPRTRRPAWRVAGLVCVVAFLAYSPVDFDRLHDLRTRVMAADNSYSDLRDVVRSGGARCALSGRVHIPNARLRPFVAYWAGIPLQRVYTDPPTTGDIQATDSIAQQVSSRSLPSDTHMAPVAVPPPPAGFRVAAQQGGWRLEGRCARQ
jgi:hypothetical protein